MKTEGLGRTDEGTGSCAGGRCMWWWWWFGGGSLVPFQTHGIATCHQNTLYCQTWVTVIGTVGLESRIFYSSQFPWLGLFPCDKRRRRRVSWSATVFVLLSLTHSLTLFLLLQPFYCFFVHLIPSLSLSFLLILSASCPSGCFLLICVFLRTHLLFDTSSLSHPLILFLSSGVLSSVLGMAVLEWLAQK